MTDTPTPLPVTEQKKCCSKSYKLWGVLALLLVFGLGLIIGKAWHYAPYRAFFGANHHYQMGMGHGYGKGGMNRAERRLDMALNAVDATQDQRDKIKSILLKAMADLPATRTQMRGLAKDGLEILSMEVIDSAKLDAARKAALLNMESHSAKHQATLLEIAAILTPAQRQKLKLLAEMRFSRHN